MKTPSSRTTPLIVLKIENVLSFVWGCPLPNLSSAIRCQNGQGLGLVFLSLFVLPYHPSWS